MVNIASVVNAMTSVAMTTSNFVTHSIATLAVIEADSLASDAFDDVAMYYYLMVIHLIDDQFVVATNLRSPRMMWSNDDRCSVGVVVNCCKNKIKKKKTNSINLIFKPLNTVLNSIKIAYVCKYKRSRWRLQKTL